MKDHDDWELSIYITDDSEIRELNKKYRQKDTATDVLSFPQERPIIGDVVLSLPYIEKQAKEYETDFIREFYNVLIHGILHLLGYTHGDEASKIKMLELQSDILNQFI